MKDFTKLNNRYLKLRRWLPMKLAYRLTIYRFQEGKTMFYVSKVSENRIKVVMYGRILYMTNAEYARWKAKVSWSKDNN